MAKLSKDRKKKLDAQKRRAIMKDIDKREAVEQDDLGFANFRGLTAKRALQKAYKQNEKADFEAAQTSGDLNLTPTYEGVDRDLINIKKYGDNAMRSRAFGSRQAKAKGGMIEGYEEGGAVETSLRPKMRPARIEQEAAEAAAVKRGNNEARRRASDTQNFSGGGSLERPNRNKKVDTSIIEQGGVTPIRALTAAMMNRRDRKEDRKYQESLKDMGMFEDGGGRANVSSSKDKMYMAPPKDMREKFRDKREKFRDGGSVRGHKSSQMSGTGFSGTY